MLQIRLYGFKRAVIRLKITIISLIFYSSYSRLHYIVQHLCSPYVKPDMGSIKELSHFVEQFEKKQSKFLFLQTGDCQ